jgi:hypothetical protein
LKVAANFTIDVTGVNVSDALFPGEESPGTTITLDAGAYEVTETLPASYNYTKSFSADCSGTIANGQTKTCTVTNDDNANAVSVTTQQKVILHDRATISGILRHTNETTAKVKFRLYSDNTCTTEVGFEEVDANPAAGQTNVQVGTATGFTITLDANPGNSTTHRWWRAFYGGNNISGGGVLNSPQETLCTEATSVTMSQ